MSSTHQNPQRSQLNHRHFRKLSDFSWNTIQFDNMRLPIKRLLVSKCNKYILKYLQHTFRTPSSIHLRSTHQNHHRSLLNHRHLAKYQTSRGTQFNLTLCDLPIKTLLASKRNQIYSEASSTHISAQHQAYTYALPIKSSDIYIKSQTFQKTLSLLAEHNSIWHFAIYQSKDCSPLNVINIFWSIFNTLFGHHQAYTYALPIKIIIDHYWITDI